MSTPTGPDTAATIGPDALTALRRVAYLLQVIRPHADEAQARLVDATEAWLMPTIADAEVVLGDRDPRSVLGAPRPADLNDPEARRAAIAEALSAAVRASAPDLETFGTSRLRASFLALPRYLGSVVAWASRWGAPLTAFPGLE